MNNINPTMADILSKLLPPDRRVLKDMSEYDLISIENKIDEAISQHLKLGYLLLDIVHDFKMIVMPAKEQK